MYRNLGWKLIPTLLLLAFCVWVAVEGRPDPDPDHKGFFGLKLQLGQDLRGGTTLVYRLVHIEADEVQKEIGRLEYQITLARAQGEPTDEMDRTLERLRAEKNRLDENFKTRKRELNNQTRDVLNNRLNLTGLAGVEVRPMGDDRVMVTLPTHVDFNAQIERIIAASGKLFFRMEADRNNEELRNLRYTDPNPDPTRYRWFPTTDSRRAWDSAEGQSWILIDFRPPQQDWMFEGENLRRVYPATSEGSQLAVGFEFKSEDNLVNRFGDMTRTFKQDNFAGKSFTPSLCILFNEKIHWAGPIKDEIRGQGIMTGFSTGAEQREMINLIRAGSLPVRLAQEGKNQTGAGLGADMIQQGLSSMVIGGGIVVLFIMLYYLAGGLIAAMSLLMNLAITLAIMVLLGATGFPATLTMPGIAGLILSIGLAVDANILIYERIREEKSRVGANLRDAVEKGFNRSAVAILDANITTIITGVILYIVGTAEIRGFAITLVIGIFASLFTALVFSRFVIGALVTSGSVKRFAMLSMIGNPRLPFMKFRGVAMAVSTVCILIGLSFFAGRGKDNLGIDFLGGYLYNVQLAAETDVELVRKGIAALKGADGNPKYPTAQVTPAFHRFQVGGGTRSDQFELRFPTRPEEIGVEVDHDKRQRDIRDDIEYMFSGGFTAYGQLPEPLPRLVEDGRDVIINQPEKMGFEIEFSMSAPVPAEIARDADLQLALESTFLWAPHSIKPSIFDQRASREESEAVRMVTYEARGHHLVVTISGVEVDPATYGTDGYDFLKEVYAEVHRQTHLAPPTPHDSTDLLPVLTAKGLVPERDNDGNVRVKIEAIPEKAELIIEYNLSEPLLKASFIVVEGETLPEDAPKDLRGQLLTRITEALGSVRMEGLAIPTGTDAADISTLGLIATVADSAKVRAFRVHTGVFEFASATNLESERRFEAVEQRITRAVRTVLEEKAHVSVSDPFPRQQIIGASIATGLQVQATYAILASLFCIILYIWLRFQNFGYGLSATMALAHDILIALGAIAFIDAFTNWTVKIDLTVIAALMTIIGYSLNDTIVVFDRIRENRAGVKRTVSFSPYVNTSVNQTLSRTVLTSLTTLFVVFVMFLLGGRALEGFAITLLVGILVGTYSTVFIASPILTIDWRKYQNVIYAFIGVAVLLLIPQAFRPIRFLPVFNEPMLDLSAYISVALLLGIWTVTLYHSLTSRKDDTGETFSDGPGRSPAAVTAAPAPAPPTTPPSALSTASASASASATVSSESVVPSTETKPDLTSKSDSTAEAKSEPKPESKAEPKAESKGQSAKGKKDEQKDQKKGDKKKDKKKKKKK